VSGYKSSRAEIAFTFDDGFKECYTIIAPVLKQYNISACFFINPSVIESSDDFRLTFLKEKLLLNENKQFMNWDDIKNLHFDGHIIGNHTLNHIALKGISYNDAFDEVSKSKSILENFLSYQCKYFAFPYGGEKYFDEIGLKAAIECHKLSFTSCNYSNYFFKNNNRILSRRHFEGCWDKRHIDFFLSKRRKYQ
jgi:peptidoglycan/xylan/chitin deacetylase (PgdA/CDA1 family)